MEGEVSNQECADGAASVQNNGCMRGGGVDERSGARVTRC